MNTSDTFSIDTNLVQVEQLEPFIDIGLTDFLDILSDVEKDVPLQLARIHAAIGSGDITELKARAHSMRGMVASFGCVGMTSALHELEISEQIPSERADSIKLELELIWQKSISAIKDWENSVTNFAE